MTDNVMKGKAGPPQSVRFSEWLGVSALEVPDVFASVRSTLAVFEPCVSMAIMRGNKWTILKVLHRMNLLLDES